MNCRLFHRFLVSPYRGLFLLVFLSGLLLLSCEREKPTYTVTFDSKGGSEVASQRVGEGKKATKPTDPTREDYIFLGWNTKTDGTGVAFDFSNTTITGNITLYAQWEKGFTVMFDSKGGSEVASQRVKEGEKAATPTDPTRTGGYIFLGWNTKTDGTGVAFDFSNTSITADITLYAQWRKIVNYYTVTFNSKGGSAVASQRVGESTKATNPTNPTRTSYIFLGWNTNTDGTGAAFDFLNTPITADITLYAQWREASTYTVTFDSKGGGAVASQSVEEGKKATLPVHPTRESYNFFGWNTQTDGTGTTFDFATPITQDLTLYAQWTTTLAVLFDAQGGTPVPNPQAIESGQQATKPANPTRTGYTFRGWNTQAEGTGTTFDFSNATITANITLYAQWLRLRAIPDSNFRAYLKERLPSNAFVGDELNIDHDSVTALKKLGVSDKNISSLEGVQYFTALEQLYCYNNQLTSLDIRQNTALELLYCYNNQLTSLDVSQNSALEILNCYENPLGGLDLWQNMALINLYCYNNQLGILDISQNTKLQVLSCNSNKLATLDVSQNTLLKRLSCSSNQLRSLDGLSKTTSLEALNCTNNQLTSLDLAQNMALRELNFTGNRLNSLDVSLNAGLQFLDCSNNPLSSLDVSKNVQLIWLFCSNNPLNSLDVSKNTKLINLICSNSGLSSLDLSKNTALQRLSCTNNSLSSLDLSKSPKLIKLDCSSNPMLETLDMRGVRFFPDNRDPFEITLSISSDNTKLATLKVHTTIKDYAAIQAAKRARGSALTISVYSAAIGSTSYTEECSNYDPISTDADKCVTP